MILITQVMEARCLAEKYQLRETLREQNLLRVGFHDNPLSKTLPPENKALTKAQRLQEEGLLLHCRYLVKVHNIVRSTQTSLTVFKILVCSVL